MPENTFDRNARAQQLAAEYRLPGRLAWLAADPNPDTERANIAALQEGGVKAVKVDPAEVERLKGAYQAARERRDGLAMVTLKHRLGELGVNLG